MPTTAILGATGKTGNALLTLLLQDPNNKINAYCRFKAKLLSQFPSLDTNKSVQIFPGAIDDVSLIASCIRDVDTIFNVLGENENIPGMHIAQDAAHAIIAALCQLGCTNGAEKVPRVICLSSSSINPNMHAGDPPLAHRVVSTAFSNAYADLALAEKFLRLHESWLRVTFVQPGALVEDVQRGHRLSLDRKGAPAFVSYYDLAAGMMEVAEAKEGYEGVGISVVSTSDEVKFEWNAPKQMVRGLVWHYAPWVGWRARDVGLF